MTTDNPLGDFLRARRAAVQPGDVGIADLGRRRVPGLRREELAMLAGVSIDYYTRLEQGRDRHPSPQIVRALARPLGLDETARSYVERLADPAPRNASVPPPERVPTGTLRILDALDKNPAYVVGHCRDVLGANPLAGALNPGFTPGKNILRFVFLAPAAREIYADWDDIAAETVATLRGIVGADPDNPRLTQLVEEISLGSASFRRYWRRQDVRAKAPGQKRFNNPLVGQIDLDYEPLAINGAEGQTLVVYHATPGSADERALALLAAASIDNASVADERQAKAAHTPAG
jgi:transcriptional regulator with XRE-family HTH domain